MWFSVGNLLPEGSQSECKEKFGTVPGCEDRKLKVNFSISFSLSDLFDPHFSTKSIKFPLFPPKCRIPCTF